MSVTAITCHAPLSIKLFNYLILNVDIAVSARKYQLVTFQPKLLPIGTKLAFAGHGNGPSHKCRSGLNGPIPLYECTCKFLFLFRVLMHVVFE